MRYLLRNAQLLSSGGVFRAADVLLSGGRIVSIGDRISCHADAVSIDLRAAAFVFPGLVDVHVHLREPGFSYKETIARRHPGRRPRGLRPRLRPCRISNPVPDYAGRTSRCSWRSSSGTPLVHVHPYGAITVGRAGERTGGPCGHGAGRAGVSPTTAAACRSESLMRAGHDARPPGLGKIHRRPLRGQHASCTAAISTTARMPAPTATAASAPRASGARSPGTSSSPSRPAAHTTSATSPRRRASRSSARAKRRRRGRHLRDRRRTTCCSRDDDLQEDGRFKMNPPLRGAGGPRRR